MTLIEAAFTVEAKTNSQLIDHAELFDILSTDCTHGDGTCAQKNREMQSILRDTLLGETTERPDEEPKTLRAIFIENGIEHGTSTIVDAIESLKKDTGGLISDLSATLDLKCFTVRDIVMMGTMCLSLLLLIICRYVNGLTFYLKHLLTY